MNYKPRISKGMAGVVWWCEGLGIAGIGMSPREAYDHWVEQCVLKRVTP